VQTDRGAIDFEAVYAFLRTAPWAHELTRSGLERALRESLCFSLYEEGRQIGLARVITDYVTYAYLCDVYVIESRRGRGLGSWLIRCVLEHPELESLKRIALITHDAQNFYNCLGFQVPAEPGSYMERIIPTADRRR
jgi:GNAT superfamily N-acetyltransferase